MFPATSFVAGTGTSTSCDIYRKDGKLEQLGSKLPIEAALNVMKLVPLAMNLNGEDKENILNMLYCECPVCMM